MPITEKFMLFKDSSYSKLACSVRQENRDPLITSEKLAIVVEAAAEKVHWMFLLNSVRKKGGIRILLLVERC